MKRTRHLELMREQDIRFDEERDRRYAEVDQERERALKIKETADLAALELAREIQTYKDEKANELREQINSERGLYLTREEYHSAHTALIDKMEAALKPLSDYVTAQQSRDASEDRREERMQPWQIWAAGAVATFVITLVVLIANGRLS